MYKHRIKKIFKTPAQLAGVLLLLAMQFSANGQEGVVRTTIDYKLFDFNGKPFANPYADISGSPFFMDKWITGSLEITGSGVFNSIPLRLDIQSQELHFRKPDKSEYAIKAGAVKQFSIIDSSAGKIQPYTFICGYPAIDNQGVNNFYLVLCNGKISFLKSMRKIIHEEKDPLSGEIKKEFRLYEDYYFYAKGEIKRIKKDKDFILGFMNDKENLVQDFVKNNKVSFKSMDDIKKLVDYYNSLP